MARSTSKSKSDSKKSKSDAKHPSSVLSFDTPTAVLVSGARGRGTLRALEEAAPIFAKLSQTVTKGLKKAQAADYMVTATVCGDRASMSADAEVEFVAGIVVAIAAGDAVVTVDAWDVRNRITRLLKASFSDLEDAGLELGAPGCDGWLVACGPNARARLTFGRPDAKPVARTSGEPSLFDAAEAHIDRCNDLDDDEPTDYFLMAK